MNEKREYEIAVQYERDGDTYYDRYYTVDSNINEAILWVKNQWHTRNDDLFPEAVDARFYGEVNI